MCLLLNELYDLGLDRIIPGRIPAWHLHALQGELEDHWAVTVNGNWRLTFRFEGKNAVLVDYQDYH
jgi:plasmid maintenance system killer protein